MFTWVLAGIFAIGIGSAIIGRNDAPQTAAPAKSVSPYRNEKDNALSGLSIKKFSWHKGGFDNVMLLTATIQNDGQRDVKDIVIECSHESNSGTRIDSNRKTIFEIFKAGKERTIKDFSMGFIHAQAASTSCRITDGTVI